MAGSLKTVNPIPNSDACAPMKRRYATLSAIVVDTVGNITNCDVIDLQDYGIVAAQPSAGITTLSVYAAETAAGSFVLVDSIGTNGAVTVVASKWNTFDWTKLAPYGFIKLVGNVSGTVIIAAKT